MVLGNFQGYPFQLLRGSLQYDVLSEARVMVVAVRVVSNGVERWRTLAVGEDERKVQTGRASKEQLNFQDLMRYLDIE